MLFRCKPGRAHVMGICGEGALGVAWLLKVHGWEVSGCDAMLGPTAKKWLNERGINVFQGHTPAHLGSGCDVVIHSNAIPADNVELTAARTAGILVVTRGKALAAWVNGIRSVAVCGTHGKTTTSCFTARLLLLAGANPAWCLGGKTNALGSNAGPDAPGTRFPEETLTPEECARRIGVVEADESDSTLADESPAISVLTNIDLDHVDHFPNEQALIRCFATLVDQTREAIAVCCEDVRALQVATAFKGACLTYGFSPEAVVRAVDLQMNADSSSFELIYRTRTLGRIVLVAGSHNVLNALGAFCAGVLLGLDPGHLAALLSEAASELPKRRFQWINREGPVRFVSDYSHHPVEVAAAMSIARLQGAKRLRIIFQPHRYSRTRALGKDFPKAMRLADEVILLPVWAASEQIVEGGETHDLYAHFRRENPDQKVFLARSLDEVHHYLNITAEAGDLIPIIGAGKDIETLVGWFQHGLSLPLETPPDYALLRESLPPEIALNSRVSLAKWSFYRTGGFADAAVDIADVPSLSALLMVCSVNHIAVRCVGAGANTWISDLGHAGVVFRLEGEAFRGFTRNGDTVAIGAGWNGPALLNRLEEEELGGLEFLEGVPGRLGGWLAMNAGAFGGEIWQHVETVRVVTVDGQARCVGASFFQPGYRHVQGLGKLTIIEATLRFTPSDRATIREKRAAHREKRKHLACGQSCGSVFRNPEDGAPAGILLDKVGAKSWRIGGASVSPTHANIICTDQTATSSDVLALALKMQRRVQKVSGVELKPEITGF